VVRVEETPLGRTVKVRIEGYPKRAVTEARDRYLNNYHPNGYGTQFSELYEVSYDGYTRVYGYSGDRYASCD
jgi:hypothetical protein